MLRKISAVANLSRTMAILFALLVIPNSSRAQRLLGLDISAWQGNISQTTWNNIKNVENRGFIIFRASRGGTTGYYDQSDADKIQGGAKSQ